MKIESVQDVKEIASKMHDSEFSEKDFGFDPDKKLFFLKSYSPFSQEEFYLEFLDTEEHKW